MSSEFCLGSPYYIPDNTASGDANTACESLSDKTVESAIERLRKEYTYCKEAKTTVVKGNYIVDCRHPSDFKKSKLLIYAKSKESCEAHLIFYKTNKVPPGFENPLKPVRK